jgi:hypothetical protein
MQELNQQNWFTVILHSLVCRPLILSTFVNCHKASTFFDNAYISFRKNDKYAEMCLNMIHFKIIKKHQFQTSLQAKYFNKHNCTWQQIKDRQYHPDHDVDLWLLGTDWRDSEIIRYITATELPRNNSINTNILHIKEIIVHSMDLLSFHQCLTLPLSS